MRELRYLCEDVLSEAAIRRIVSIHSTKLTAIPWISRGGKGNVRRKLTQAREAAKNGVAVLVLIDLDTTPCARAALTDWLGHPANMTCSNLIFRIAVREVEAWLLADCDGISKRLGIAKSKVPRNVEAIESPKDALINLSRSSKLRPIRDGLVPSTKSGLSIGPEYNDILTDFVEGDWNFSSAALVAPSLQRFLLRLQKFASNNQT